jgi:hypothetical protein
VTQQLPFEIRVKMAKVVAQIGLMNPALLGALAEANYDLVNHHRRSILKHHKLPAKSSATRMLAARLHGYGRTRRVPESFADLKAESFAAAKSGQTFGDSLLIDLETGRSISASGPMAIPFAAMTLQGGARSAAMRRFREQLNSGALKIIRGNLLIRREGRKPIKPLGILVKQRTQRPMLGFYRQWDSVLARHMAKFDRILDLAMTEAGREDLAARAVAAENGRAASRDVYREFINNNPGQHAKARQVAARASAAARKISLANSEGRA